MRFPCPPKTLGCSGLSFSPMASRRCLSSLPRASRSRPGSVKTSLVVVTCICLTSVVAKIATDNLDISISDFVVASAIAKYHTPKKTDISFCGHQVPRQETKASVQVILENLHPSKACTVHHVPLLVLWKARGIFLCARFSSHLT